MVERGVSIPGTWRLSQQRLRLVGELCRNLDPATGEICQTYIFPPRDVCPVCKGEVIIDSQDGEIFSLVREAIARGKSE